MKKFNINFKLVLISQIISLIGSNILRFALQLFILDLTQSVELFAIVTAMSQIPIILFAIPGGIIADRMNKKKLIVILDFAKTFICIGLLVIFSNSIYSVANLTIFVIFLITLDTLFHPILTAAIPSIVKKDVMIEANGAINSINAVSKLLSFILGGILMATIGLMNIIILCGVAFLFSTIIDLFIRIPFVKQEIIACFFSTLVSDMRESLNYISKRNPFILKISMVGFIISFLFLPMLTISLPYIVRIEFEASDELFGLSQAIVTFGTLLGGILVGKIKSWLKSKYFYRWILLLAGLCLVLAISVRMSFLGTSVLISFWIFNVGLMLIMVVCTFINVTLMSQVQEKTPMNLLGKVISLIITISNLATPIGQYLFGIVMDVLSDRIFILFIAIGFLTGFVSLISKKMFQD